MFPAYLWGAAQQVPAEALQQLPIHGGFSLVEHACHLRDYEAEGCLGRIHRILSEHDPFLADFEGDRLARERNYKRQSFAEAVDDFSRKRRKTLALLHDISNEQAARTATLGTMGTISLRRLVEVVREHDRMHKQEIDNLLAEIQEKA